MRGRCPGPLDDRDFQFDNAKIPETDYKGNNYFQSKWTRELFYDRIIPIYGFDLILLVKTVMKKVFDAYILLQMLTGNWGNSGNSGNLKYLKTMQTEDKQWHTLNNFYFLDKKLRRCFKIPFKISKRNNAISLVHDMTVQLAECEECTSDEYHMLGY